jgi:hypothetical protein
VLLDKLGDRAKRDWYADPAVEYGWSRDVLVHQIETRLLDRSGGASNFSARRRPVPRVLVGRISDGVSVVLPTNSPIRIPGAGTVPWGTVAGDKWWFVQTTRRRVAAVATTCRAEGSRADSAAVTNSGQVVDITPPHHLNGATTKP